MTCFAISLIQSQPNQLNFHRQLLCIDNNETCSIGDVNRDGILMSLLDVCGMRGLILFLARCVPWDFIHRIMPKTTANIYGMSMAMGGRMYSSMMVGTNSRKTHGKIMVVTQ